MKLFSQHNNNKLSFIALLLCYVLPGQVNAAESAKIHVNGVIAPASCDINLTNDGKIDYGDINAKTLSNDNYTALAIKHIPFTISCTASAKIAVRFVNEKQNTLASDTAESAFSGTAPIALFNKTKAGAVGLGFGNSSEKIGGYGVRIDEDSVKNNDQAVDGIYQDDNYNGNWQLDSDQNAGDVFGVTRQRYISWSDKGSATPVAINELSGTIDIQAYITKLSELNTQKPVKLDGQTSVELIYL